MSLTHDLRRGIPAGVAFRRTGSATLVGPGGRLVTVSDNVPRFPARDGEPSGLLVEGEAFNLIESPSNAKDGAWLASGGVRANWMPDIPAPDGTAGVFRLARSEPRADSQMQIAIRGPSGAEFGVASIWLRSPTVAGPWRLRLRDTSSYYDTASRDVTVGTGWRRFDVAQLWQYRATGTKRFIVADWAPPADELLPSVDVWGAQYERAAAPSSTVATTGGRGHRAADEVTFAGASLEIDAGRLTVELPEGGRRDAVVIDANGAGNGLRIEYSPSGWIVARVGGIDLAGLCEVTADRMIELQWSSAGVQISTGADAAGLTARASSRARPRRLDCGALARLGMTVDGERPLNSVVGAVALDDLVGAIARVAMPVFVPSRYALVFADEFDDPDVGRINENAVGGRPGAPAWRSRYNQDRKTVINQEKQIYVDVDFAGTGRSPLGVQPFSIANSVLRIRADRADPVRVSPHIWNYRYVSGCITSQYTHRQKYGYFEIRAKLPLGKGFWPGFWLLPSSNVWPPEIDPLECSGARPMSVRQGKIEKVRQPGLVGSAWVDGVIAIGDAFHWYAAEWTEKTIAFFLDGRKTLEFENRTIHEDMYLLANLALGSHDPGWIPDPDESTPLPGYYEIDYIRAYSRT